MIMIHGNHRSLSRLAHHFSGTHRMLLDMPGHGNSGPWDGVADIQALVSDAAAQVAEPGVVVFGHSFGATAALRLAVDHTGLVSRLALYEPVCFTPVVGTPAYGAYLDRFSPVANGSRPVTWMRPRRLQRLVGRNAVGRPPRFRAPGHGGAIWFIRATERAFEGDLGRVFDPGRLDRLTCGVTLMLGRRTEPIMPHVMDALCRRLTGAVLVRIDGAGHMGPLTHPGRVAQAMGQSTSS